MTDEITGELISAGGEVATEVGKKLVTKVSKGIGGLYRPIGHVRMAKAEAKSRVILAKADAEVAEIQQRAMHRLQAEEARRQINFEAITAQALPYLKEAAEPDKMDDDWIASFFDKAKIVSNEALSVSSACRSCRSRGAGCSARTGWRFLLPMAVATADGCSDDRGGRNSRANAQCG